MTLMEFSVEKYIQKHLEIIKQLDIDEINNVINLVSNAFSNEKKIIIFGNGGSALTASHFINDWNKSIQLYTKRKFRGISLTDNIGLITSYANDISYDEIFAGQLRSIVDPEDLVIGISGSGNSINVANGIKVANECQAETLGLVGYDGGIIKSLCNHNVWVKSFDMQLCEDAHFMIGHLIMKSMCDDPIN